MKMLSTTVRRIISSTATLAGLLASALGTAHAQELNLQHAAVRAVIAVQNEVTPGLMATAAVLGTAVGVDEASHPVLVVYVDRNNANVGATIRSLPLEIRGTLVRVEPTDKFRAMVGKPGGGGGGSGVSHTAIQTPPIKLGTSGGWSKDLANGYCCGGTLGSLIQVNGVKYVLSNYHVFESDIVTGGNGIVAATGDSIIQPGLIDVRCDASGAQTVATLKTISSLPNNLPNSVPVDCSVAQVAQVTDPNDPTKTIDAVSSKILEIETISAQTASAVMNQAVKKSGRTTGLTRSKVSGLNATISVTYDNECAGGTAFTQTFVGQILISNSGSKFLNSGDSGSLMVEDITTNPRAVGLLYAGSSTIAVANPIGDVLNFIGSKLGGTATMVGQ